MPRSSPRCREVARQPAAAAAASDAPRASLHRVSRSQSPCLAVLCELVPCTLPRPDAVPFSAPACGRSRANIARTHSSRAVPGRVPVTPRPGVRRPRNLSPPSENASRTFDRRKLGPWGLGRRVSAPERAQSRFPRDDVSSPPAQSLIDAWPLLPGLASRSWAVPKLPDASDFRVRHRPLDTPAMNPPRPLSVRPVMGLMVCEPGRSTSPTHVMYGLLSPVQRPYVWEKVPDHEPHGKGSAAKNPKILWDAAARLPPSHRCRAGRSRSMILVLREPPKRAG